MIKLGLKLMLFVIFDTYLSKDLPVNFYVVYRMHEKELNSIEDEEVRYKRLVELNVYEQCINLIKTAAVHMAHAARNLRLHGWAFDLKTGKLLDLEIDLNAILKMIMRIYKII
jgi:carbonic anhydrase